MFIGLIVGATIAFTQSIDIIRTPLINSMSEYRPNDYDGIKGQATQEDMDVTEAWNNIQEEVRRVFTKTTNFK